MPLYRFHLRTSDDQEYDDAGVTFADLDAAYLQACETIPGLSVDLLREGRDPMACAFVIADAEDRELLAVPFDECVRRAARVSPPSSDAATPLERAQCLVGELRAERALLWVNLRQTSALLAQIPMASPPTG